MCKALTAIGSLVHCASSSIWLEMKFKLGIMGNFMCQLVWAKGCPDSWVKTKHTHTQTRTRACAHTHFTSGCVCEGISRKDQHLNLSKDDLPSSMPVSIIQSIEGPKRTKSWRKHEFSLCLLYLRQPSASILRHQSSWFLSLQTLGLATASTFPQSVLRNFALVLKPSTSNQKLDHQLLWCSGVGTWTERHH